MLHHLLAQRLHDDIHVTGRGAPGDRKNIHVHPNSGKEE